jgi:hypothetical protein
MLFAVKRRRPCSRAFLVDFVDHTLLPALNAALRDP